jgi:hypothetical protein
MTTALKHDIFTCSMHDSHVMTEREIKMGKKVMTPGSTVTQKEE